MLVWDEKRVELTVNGTFYRETAGNASGIYILVQMLYFYYGPLVADQ